MNETLEDSKFLYKYRPIDPDRHTEKIFTQSELKFSRPLSFNDPFDCRPQFSFTAGEDKIRKYFFERLPNFEPHLVSRQQRRLRIKEVMKSKNYKKPSMQKSIKKTVLKDNINQVGICCFSEIQDNILMWSHYADSHKGICLQFEGTSNTPFFGEAQKVVYQTEYPIINPYVDEPSKLVEKALLTKAKFWNYEKEWRILSVIKGPGKFKFPKEHLNGVILGANISDENIERVSIWQKR